MKNNLILFLGSGLVGILVLFWFKTNKDTPKDTPKDTSKDAPKNSNENEILKIESVRKTKQTDKPIAASIPTKNKLKIEKMYKAESFQSLQQKNAQSTTSSVNTSNSSLKSVKPKNSMKNQSFEGKVRCKYWPDCKFSHSVFLSNNSDNSEMCPFWHPDT